MNERDPCCITVSAVIVWFDLLFVVLGYLMANYPLCFRLRPLGGAVVLG